jgi:hypothetical protein
MFILSPMGGNCKPNLDKKTEKPPKTDVPAAADSGLYLAF